MSLFKSICQMTHSTKCQCPCQSKNSKNLYQWQSYAIFLKIRLNTYSLLHLLLAKIQKTFRLYPHKYFSPWKQFFYAQNTKPYSHWNEFPCTVPTCMSSKELKCNHPLILWKQCAPTICISTPISINKQTKNNKKVTSHTPQDPK